MAYQLTQHDVAAAFRQQIEKWARIHANEIRSFEQKFPRIGDKPAMYKAAVWLNFGLTSTQGLLPNSTAASIITKASVPLTIVSIANQGFKAIHDHQVKRDNALLKADYLALRNQFIKLVDSASTQFLSTTYGNQLFEATWNVFKNSEFSNPADATSRIGMVIRHAKLIENDPGIIGKQVDSALRPNYNKVLAIYNGINRFMDSAKTLYAKSEKKVTVQVLFEGPLIRDGKPVKDYDWSTRIRNEKDRRYILAHLNHFKIWHKDNPNWVNSGPYKDDITYVVRLNKPEELPNVNMFKVSPWEQALKKSASVLNINGIAS